MYAKSHKHQCSMFGHVNEQFLRLNTHTHTHNTNGRQYLLGIKERKCIPSCFILETFSETQKNFKLCWRNVPTSEVLYCRYIEGGSTLDLSLECSDYIQYFYQKEARNIIELYSCNGDGNHPIIRAKRSQGRGADKSAHHHCCFPKVITKNRRRKKQ